MLVFNFFYNSMFVTVCYFNNAEIFLSESKGRGGDYRVGSFYCEHSKGVNHRVGRVLSFFSSRWSWDSPNPSPAGECAPPSIRGGGAHSLAREGLRESQFQWGDILYTVVLCLYMYVLCGVKISKEATVLSLTSIQLWYRAWFPQWAQKELHVLFEKKGWCNILVKWLL
jgi:hypothetical protein